MKKKLKFIGNLFKWTFILTLLPIIFSFVLYLHLSEITKTKHDFHLTTGRVAFTGFTKKVHKGKSMRSIRTKTKVFFIQLKDNDTLYSFYSKNADDYRKLFANIKENDLVKIYNKGFEDTQNTVDIVQLENFNRILIDKKIYNEKNCGNAILLSIFLFLYFALPIYFFYKSRQNEQKINNSKKHIR